MPPTVSPVIFSEGWPTPTGTPTSTPTAISGLAGVRDAGGGQVYTVVLR